MCDRSEGTSCEKREMEKRKITIFISSKKKCKITAFAMEYEDLFVVVYMVHETSFITFTKKKLVL